MKSFIIPLFRTLTDQVIHTRTLVDVDSSHVEEVQDPEVVACGVDLGKRRIPLRFPSLLSLPSHDNFISIQLAVPTFSHLARTIFSATSNLICIYVSPTYIRLLLLLI